MSLLSPERFIAVLGSTGAGLARVQDGQQQWLGSSSVGARAGWSEALEALAQLLLQHNTPRAELAVVLSSQFSRCCLVPWSDDLSHPDDLAAYARVCFDTRYGEDGGDWRICIAPERAGHDRIAVALPEALLQRLSGLARELGLRLRSVQPYLMAAFNHFLPDMARDDLMFVLAEPQRAVLMLARDGQWRAVEAQACVDSDAALRALIAREQALLELPLPVYLHAPGRQVVPVALEGVTLCNLSVQDAQVLSAMARVVA